MLANRNLRSEVEGEMVRNMCLLLEAGIKAWSEMYICSPQIIMPTSIAEIEHVKIGIPKMILRTIPCDLSSWLGIFFDLHISSITIAFYEVEQADPPVRSPIEFTEGVLYIVSDFIRQAESRYKAGTQHLLSNIEWFTVIWGELPKPEQQSLLSDVVDSHDLYDVPNLDIKLYMNDTDDECIGATWVESREAFESRKASERGCERGPKLP